MEGHAQIESAMEEPKQVEETRVKINFATKEQLKSIPKIGDKSAEAMISDRSKHGNITKETLKYIIKVKVSKEMLKFIDFEPNPDFSKDSEDENEEEEETEEEETEHQLNFEDLPIVPIITPGQGQAAAAIKLESQPTPSTPGDFAQFKADISQMLQKPWDSPATLDEKYKLPAPLKSPKKSQVVSQAITRTVPIQTTQKLVTHTVTAPTYTVIAPTHTVTTPIVTPNTQPPVVSSAPTNQDKILDLLKDGNLPVEDRLKAFEILLMAEARQVTSGESQAYGDQVEQREMSHELELENLARAHRVQHAQPTQPPPIPEYIGNMPSNQHMPQRDTCYENIAHGIHNMGMGTPLNINLDHRGREGKMTISINPKNLQFDGRSSWLAFKNRFELCAKVNGWGELESRYYLSWSLTGKAAEYHAIITSIQDFSYKEMMEKLDSRFGTREIVETSRVRFAQALQDPKETLEDWSDRVMTLATRAYVGLPDQFLMKEAISKFCQGCSDKEAGKHACTRQPRTMQEALDTIKYFQYISQAIDGRRPKKSQQSQVEDPVAYAVQGNQPSVTDSPNETILSAVKKLQRTVAQLTKRKQRSRACFHCNQMGHFRKDFRN